MFQNTKLRGLEKNRSQLLNNRNEWILKSHARYEFFLYLWATLEMTVIDFDGEYAWSLVKGRRVSFL